MVSVAWLYTGLNAEDIEARITTPYEPILTTLVDNIQHIESTSYNGEAVVRIFLQPGASLDIANAQVVASSGVVQHFLPPGIQPPEIINFSASSVPAVLDGSQQIAVPALVSTLCICIVFMPLFLLGGVARYLFVPLAVAVVFAKLASYFLSRTLFHGFRKGSSDASNSCAAAYRDLLT